MEKDLNDHSGGETTDYEDDFRDHTEDEDETHDEGDDPNNQGGNGSFLLLLSQHGNESIVLDDNKDGKMETSIEKERKETRETKDTRVDKKLTAVKNSAVGG